MILADTIAGLEAQLAQENEWIEKLKPDYFLMYGHIKQKELIEAEIVRLSTQDPGDNPYSVSVLE